MADGWEHLHVRLDKAGYDALCRLARKHDRSLASMLRTLVRQAAAEQGLWASSAPADKGERRRA